MNIESKQILLRRFEQADFENTLAYLSDAQTMRYIEPIYDAVRTQDFLEQYALQKSPVVYAIVHKASTHVIGYVIYHPFEKEDCYEIGLLLQSEYCGKGYGTEIMHTLIDHAFHIQGLQELTAFTVKDNAACRALLEKLGFTDVSNQFCLDNADEMRYSLRCTE